MYRSLPAEEIVAQACAHGAPSDAKGEATSYRGSKPPPSSLKRPIAYGVLNKMGDGLPAPHRQEGYIVHLGDHDWSSALRPLRKHHPS